MPDEKSEPELRGAPLPWPFPINSMEQSSIDRFLGSMKAAGVKRMPRVTPLQNHTDANGSPVDD